MAAEREGQRLQRAFAEQRCGIEARRLQLALPAELASLGEFDMQLHRRRCGERRIQRGQLAVAVHRERAGDVGVAGVPREAQRAAALVTGTEDQLAGEIGVTVRRAQRELAQFDAAVGPASGQVEAIGGKHVLAGLRHLDRADVHAVHDQLHRQVQRQVAGACAFIRARGGQGHRDTCDVERGQVHALAQQRPEVQVQPHRRQLHHGAVAIVVAHAGKPQRPRQPPLRLLHLQRTATQRFGLRQGKAQPRPGAQHPPQHHRHHHQQGGKCDGDAFEPLHGRRSREWGVENRE